jgi:hypothetical protein
MSRKFVLLLSVVALAVFGVITITCGNSNSSTTNTACTGGPYNVVGDWNGTFTGNGTTSAIGAIDASGLAAFFDTSGDTALLPSITGACSFSGAETIYSSVINGGQAATGTAQGNVNSATSITGAESIGGGSATFTLSPGAPLSVAPTALSGTMIGQVGGGGDLLNLAFTPSGTGNSMSFTGTDIGTSCTVSGTFTQQGTSNVFDVSYSVSSSGSCAASTSSGIAFESSTDYFDVNGLQAVTYLYADVLGPAGAFVIEIYP